MLSNELPIYDNKRPELFLISSEAYQALSEKEVDATYRDMEELDIARLPYSKTHIGLNIPPHKPMVDVLGQTYGGVDLANPEYRAMFENEKVIDIQVKLRKGKFISIFDVDRVPSWLEENEHDAKVAMWQQWQEAEKLCYSFRKALIVLLATKNIIKRRVENKRLKLGIGKKKNNYLYTTTISIPPTSRLPRAAPTGANVRPHLRRGHIRHQHWGPKSAFVKKIWIQPCIVNADENFVSSRVAYNTSVTPPLELQT